MTIVYQFVAQLEQLATPGNDAQGCSNSNPMSAGVHVDSAATLPVGHLPAERTQATTRITASPTRCPECMRKKCICKAPANSVGCVGPPAAPNSTEEPRSPTQTAQKEALLKRQQEASAAAQEEQHRLRHMKEASAARLHHRMAIAESASPDRSPRMPRRSPSSLSSCSDSALLEKLQVGVLCAAVQ